MAVLSAAKAESVDIFRGAFNNVVDMVGFPRPEEALGTPADIVNLAGLPTVKQWLPQPVDGWARVTKMLRSGGGPPGLPPPPRNMPRLESLFPFPGEAGPAAAVGEAQAASATGAQNKNPEVAEKLGQRYYQRY